MPVESRPLFRPDVLREQLQRFTAPARTQQARERLALWADLIRTARVDTLNERELLPDFITDLFVTLLGYEAPPGRDGRYSLSREKHVEVDAQYADAVLGRFVAGAPGRFVVVVEGKGPRDPLERPHGSRRMSAVDQGYKYAINLACDWIIITNIRQLRLYSKGANQQTYERFDTERLAADPAHLHKLAYLLGAERVLPPDGAPCHLDELLTVSEQAGRELTKEFYRSYARLREEVFDRIGAANPALDRRLALTATQKILDRLLFTAFCEDRSLLPALTIQNAYQHADPYNPRPIWDNFKGLFAAINRGNAHLQIPRYNGGLFADDPTLDQLVVPDEVCRMLHTLGDYDYRPLSEAAAETDGQAPLVDVDILGHIFEQSITDLERLRESLDGDGQAAAVDEKNDRRSRRKREGAFYTPSFITRYIVEQALGGVLHERFESLRQRHETDAARAAKAALVDPNGYILTELKPAAREALLKFWEDWRHELGTIRILDPSCGSGAFLVEAFDQLYAAYEVANDRLADLSGSRTLFDLDRQILQNNLYGVDLNEEAVEICRLSLWIKTAQRGRELTALDHTIRVGNSIVDDPAVHPRAFDWRQAFPEAFAQGGFDVVVGNPPYVRQELLGPIKPHLEKRFASYHGMADLYVYFYELGLRVLKPAGRLSLVVTNKWLKAGYAEPLRRHLGEQSWVESLVDFGHARQIFEDADVFPCILVTRKPAQGQPPPVPRGAVIPREQLRIDDLTRQIDETGYPVDRERFGADAWQLEPPEVIALLARIQRDRPTLASVVGSPPLRGILTGCNGAFLIDTATRNRLVAADPACERIIRPYVRGEDIERWHLNWAGVWMIAIKSSVNEPWPWAGAGDDAEAVFARSYPSLHAHMKKHEPALRKRQDKGRFWWELRSCAYWDKFEQPKLTYQEIQFHSWFGLSPPGTCGNNKTYILPTDDLWLLAVLNSPLMWWHNWRYLPHMKDEAMFPAAYRMETLPIAGPSPDQRTAAETDVRRLIETAQSRQSATRTILDWLKVEFDVLKPTLKLQAATELDADAFVREVKKSRARRKTLTPAALAALRDEHTRTIAPLRARAAEALAAEQHLSNLVNNAYGLTPDEVQLMWQTAPPRMPVGCHAPSLSPLS